VRTLSVLSVTQQLMACNGYIQVEAQRRYLGGDSEHSILVKGLDFALLQQNKARLASTSSKQDDEALEEVFAQTASTSSAPALKKRSRADIIRELKERRADGPALEQSAEESAAEKQVNSSKFRPIGFKRIGPSNEEKVKKKKGREGGEPKKKKRKVGPSAVDGGGPPKDTTTAPPPPVEHQASASTLPQPIQQETQEDDFDIFADAGEYKGMEFGSDDDSAEGSEKDHAKPSDSGPAPSAEDMSASSRRGWFDDAAEREPEASPPVPAPQTATDQPPPVPEAGAEAEEEEKAQLAPLTSSAIPSIRDFLEMDAAIEEKEKRKARKEKRKGKNKGS
jgi:IK cytokine